MSEYNIQMNKYNALNAEYDQLYPQPMKHASTHAKDGSDPITPSMIGTYTQTQIDTLLQKKADLDEGGKVPTSQLPSLGLSPQIIVTAPTGSTVTCTKGTTVLTAEEVEGTWTFDIPEYGEWTVSATVDGKAMTASINIKVAGVFNLTLATNLEDASWDVISSISEAGIASSIWSIGDTKTIKVDGVPYTAQIIGFAHDTKTAGGTAGITFQLVDCLDAVAQINVEQTVVGGWRGSVMRGFTLPNIFSQLDADLQAVIKPVDKLSSVGSGLSTIETTSDKLFLLSEIEVFGTIKWSFAGEGTQYEWYAAGNSKIKNVRGSASPWWERSPRGQNNYFDFVDDKGTASCGSPNSPLRGVSFAFCV